MIDICEDVLQKMTSWRNILRQRQLDIDAADREELEAKRKRAGLPDECINSDESYRDIGKPDISSLSTEVAAAELLGTDVVEASSDDLSDSCECNASLPLQDMSTAAYVGGLVDDSATDRREATNAEYDVAEITEESSPTNVGFTHELKLDTNCATDAESFGSGDFIESDQISSSVIDSPSSHQQHPFSSLSSTPEHLISTNVSSSANMLSCASDCSETYFAGEISEPVSDAATHVELSSVVQSPDHKRTRRHADKHGVHGRRKHNKTIRKGDTKLMIDGSTLQPEAETKSKTSDVHLSPSSRQLDFDEFHSELSETVQHSEMVSDVGVTDDSTTQVVRQVSYLKAVGVGAENAITSQQQNDHPQSATDKPARDDHSSATVTAKTKTGSKQRFLEILLPRSKKIM